MPRLTNQTRDLKRAIRPVDTLLVTRPILRWRIGSLLGAVAIVVACLVVRIDAQQATGTTFTGDLAGASSAGTAPPVTKTAHPQRLLPPVAEAVGEGGFTFEATARWDPCRPVRYVISGAEPFAGANAMLTGALRQAGADSGLRFESAGSTTEAASPDREWYQPDRYGKTWAPVLIAWTSESVVPQLAGPVIGLGGAVSARVHGITRLVSGVVYFDAPELSLIALQGNGYASMQTAMLHEIGHLLGLGHVQDENAVMYPTNMGQGDYAAGDLRGLAYAGKGPCSPYT